MTAGFLTVPFSGNSTFSPTLFFLSFFFSLHSRTYSWSVILLLFFFFLTFFIRMYITIDTMFSGKRQWRCSIHDTDRRSKQL